MKNLGKSVSLIAIVALGSFSSCKKPKDGAMGPQGNQGPSGPSYTGNLVGHVDLFDVSGQKILTNLAGDSVSMDGTTNVAITDANGMYTFQNINTGNYNLTITRSSFGKTKIQNIQFLGIGDNYKDTKISKVPTINVSSVVATDTLKLKDLYLLMQ
jgi:hypothetical protein